jgi:hypothetical protein
LLALLAACEARGTAPGARVATPVQVSASLTGSAVEWLSVEATASDISVPIVVTLDAEGASARGTIVVPSGPARTFTARGYDAEGTLTHRATMTVDVVPGNGAGLSLLLLPATDVDAATYREDRVTITPADVALAPGGTRRLAAAVVRADGTPVPEAAITWASLDPAVASVSGAGLLSAVAPGSTQVIAMSGGGAAVTTVVVQ